MGRVEAAAKSACHPVSQGQWAGRCSTIFLAEVEICAEGWMSLRRMVPLRALPSWVPASVPMARERLKAVVASTSQAAVAVKITKHQFYRRLEFKPASASSICAR